LGDNIKTDLEGKRECVEWDCVAQGTFQLWAVLNTGSVLYYFYKNRGISWQDTRLSAFKEEGSLM
jgi:hypothetical protein